MYYKINQEPSKYESKFSIEYLNDMSHFFGLLNNEGIRKPFFEEAGFFSKISSDESVVKEYVRNNMKDHAHSSLAEHHGFLNPN